MPRLLVFQMLKTLKNINISNINKLIFGYLNINSLKNKSDLSTNKSKA